MSFLIIGGLLALALIAIIAVYLLASSEKAVQGTQKAQGLSGSPESQKVQANDAERAAPPVPATPVNLAAQNNEFDMAWFRLSSELRDLHGQVKDVENHLSALNEMAFTIESTLHHQEDAASTGERIALAEPDRATKHAETSDTLEDLNTSNRSETPNTSTFKKPDEEPYFISEEDFEPFDDDVTEHIRSVHKP
jgi:hypothetical protein